ncbi:TOMM precursor leader peptide-binding protein [Streptomyces liangshanensis]|uniref:TOMM leader peptide-binding protein n=1 Tax=Streptomyces liangshanensis TaxID=2717324 RepID=A0A6G9GXK3_9ACTN|nr:TOMM precursor leader peptide-binding protein [Streptomyces liangshanensis]QIQ02786.1 TOMM precursor leader peptide-binding protein [Streptomyces liangshanensis]
MHPKVKPALRRAWRERQTVQFGVTRAHAVLVGPVDTATGSFLELLDGTRGLPLLREEARAMGLPEGRADALVERLAEAGVLDDPAGGGAAADALRERAGVVERLRPDLASLSVVHREPGAGMARLAARRALRVQVRGAGRVGAAVAALLAAAGVGRVDVLDGGFTEEGDVAPGGLPYGSVGERRDTAARQLVRRSAAGGAPREAERARAGGGEPALALVVVAPRDGLAVHAPDPVVAETWIASGTPHLYAGVIEATGVVGPLVLPGGSACAGCLALERADRDPGWPRLLAQWRSGRGVTGAQACDVGLATAVAGLAAAHALAFLDGELPGTTGARWEVSLPQLDWRSSRTAPHPECPCGAAGGRRGERLAEALPPHDTMTASPA